MMVLAQQGINHMIAAHACLAHQMTITEPLERAIDRRMVDHDRGVVSYKRLGDLIGAEMAIAMFKNLKDEPTLGS